MYTLGYSVKLGMMVSLNQELAAWIQTQKQGVKTLVVGISGAQGTGKSTLAHTLKGLLSDKYSVALLSLDDLYLSQDKRAELAKNIHPLFQTRGVPCTHNVGLGLRILEQLKSGQGDVLLPRFDKQTDNPKSKALWERCKTPVDIVLFEGWCLGLESQNEAELLEPINGLEAQEDKHALWRKQVNKALETEYQNLFQMIDKMIYLKAPSFESVFVWRKQQEAETFANQSNGAGMDDNALRQFMAHYERLTRHGIATLPQTVDVVLTLDELHQYVDVLYRN